MEKQYSLKNPLKQTPYEILKGVLFKILQSSLFIRHYATNLALIQEKLEVCLDIFHGFDYSKFQSGTDNDRAQIIKGGVNFLMDSNKND